MLEQSNLLDSTYPMQDGYICSDCGMYVVGIHNCNIIPRPSYYYPWQEPTITYTIVDNSELKERVDILEKKVDNILKLLEKKKKKS